MLIAISKLKERKGFTLVELIVVLVILAVLAAMLVPTLLGYIDKARESSVVSNADAVRTATQSQLIKMAATDDATDGSTPWWQTSSRDMVTKKGTDVAKEIMNLAGIDNNQCSILWVGYSTESGTGDANLSKDLSIDYMFYAEGDSAPFTVATFENGIWTSKTFTSSGDMRSTYSSLTNKAVGRHTLRNKFW